jgi:hypothetical protein
LREADGKNIESVRPIHLYRYNNARLIHVSIDNTESTETVTFVCKDEKFDSPKPRSKWCYYDPKKFRDALKEAIENDKRVDILVKRFMMKVKIKDSEKTKNKIEDWIESVVIVNREG